jgi:hypothetical protein
VLGWFGLNLQDLSTALDLPRLWDGTSLPVAAVAAAAQMQDELAWLAQAGLAADRAPAASLHCLCTAP